ncbi:hypothetical protein MTO96_042385, partial [Rhipicephalus appendiculatus]
MYALVRFLDDQDNRRHVISIKDILDLEPKDKSDFDNKAVYTVFWRDDIDVNPGNYSAQILMLGDTEEEVRDRTKRVPVPKVTVEESEEEEPTASAEEETEFDADNSEEKNWQPAGGKVGSSTVQKPARDENAGLLPEQGSTTGASAELEVGSAAGEISSKKHAQFTYLLDGSLHLQNGVILSKLQASRIMAHKKPTLVVKETAQAIWGQSGLAIRSVKGGLAPRNRGTAEVAKPRLTPEKVEIVA